LVHSVIFQNRTLWVQGEGTSNLRRMKLGIESLLGNDRLIKSLKNRRIVVLSHAASVDHKGQHSLDALMAVKGINIEAAFGPQHGFHSEKQDNMIESGHFFDQVRNIPIYSLYSEVRKPTAEMLNTFDVLLIDIQDIGYRVYTYLSTVFAMLEACAANQKQVWVLDRPNPAGRKIEGIILETGWESFIGPAPMILRHGLTIGEVARWYKDHAKLDLDLHIAQMQEYNPEAHPGFGWPVGELSWVNPSPNASSLNMVRCYAGTVLFEGTPLSEGRGTSTPLEIFGAPDLDTDAIRKIMEQFAPQWLDGCILRSCLFEPTSGKYTETVSKGWQIHTDNFYYQYDNFNPFKLCSLVLKAIRTWDPHYPLWLDIPYEYEKDRLPIDLLNGGPFLRNWVDDEHAVANDLEERLFLDTDAWREVQNTYRIY
jgi:uncharacterized protein YbbC (DUF1343 family)